MPHTFPTRKLVDGEAPDPEALNEQILPMAAKLGGRLNEHDIAANQITFATLGTDAYYSGHIKRRSSSPDLTGGGAAAPWAAQAAAGDTPAEVDDSPAWGVLKDVNAPSEDFSVTVDTGEDLVFVLAQLQYFSWLGAIGATPAQAPSRTNPLRVQFALRMDGNTIDETITGAYVWPDPAPQPFYRVDPDATEFDWRQIRYVQNAVGLSSAAHPCRMTWAMPVNEGSHVFDVVSRRIPQSDGKTDENGTGTSVRVLNRQLFVLRIKGFSPGEGDTPAVTVTAYEDGDVVSQASLFTDKLNPIKDKLNDLDAASVERGALRGLHLPSVVYGASAKGINPGAGIPIINVYPGYETPSVNWITVSDGGLDTLVITNGGAGWNLAANSGTLVVIANVQVAKVDWIGASVDVRALGCLAIAYTDQAGTRRIAGVSEVYINAHNADEVLGNTILNIEDDAPLTWVISTGSLIAAGVTSISQIEIVGSVWDGGAVGAGVEMRTQRGSVTAFILRNTTLS